MTIAGSIVSGLLLLPMVAGLMLTATVSGQLIAKISGLVIVPAGVYLLSTLNADSPVQLVCAYLALLGAGMGLLMQNLVLPVQNAFPRSEVGTATSANNFFREIGATVATAAVGALFAERLTGSLSGLALSLGGKGTDSLTPELVRSLPESVRDQVVHSYVDALLPIFAGLSVVALAALALAFFLPDRRLREDEPESETADAWALQIVAADRRSGA
ncbi:hypothetical protein [Nonomuraea sp. JJY05]|uniref:hypothetical protein n=1 Tax=Nonomuraea sp. JJY05 TaxID=3350255 RepID=UPI00373F30C6